MNGRLVYKMADLKKKYPWMLDDSEPCACEECMEMCSRPCWPLPEEAEQMIELGYTDRMMLDWWVGGGELISCDDDYEYRADILILSPACKGNEGRRASGWPDKSCTLQNDLGLCKIHGICKPYEGRISRHDRDSDNAHKKVSVAWNTEYGRSVVERWRDEVDY